MTQITTATAAPKGKGKKELSHVRIESGKNGGFAVYAHYKEPPPKDGKWIPAPEPEPNFFEGVDGMMKHVTSLFGSKDK